MHILISNDDGVSAPGIEALAREMKTIASVDVIAPDRNQSGSSHALTLHRPLHVRKLANNFYCVDGTPTDCVHMGLTGLFETPADIVVSGLNKGANLGDDVLYSGTVAAAMEGRFLGFPALAFSMVGQLIKHYDTGAVIARQIIQQLRPNILPAKTILNINIPDVPLADIKGIKVTRLGARHIAEPLIKSQDPRGNTLYWIGPPGNASDAGSGTDFYAVAQHCVSVTPLSFDMTHYKVFDNLNALIDKIDWQI